MPRWPRWVEQVRAWNDRAAARRTPGASLAFAVLFLGAALVWARLPSARPLARHVWTALLLILALRDCATGMRALARRHGWPPWAWAAATALFGAVGVAAAAAVALAR
ncbi:MAG TPA: hypothetical protein VGQ83_34740 [Polyangia bacterium]